MIRESEARRIKALAAESGFPFAAFAAPRPASEDAAFLSRWAAEGKAAGMGWLAKDPSRRGDPSALLGAVRGLVCLGVPYPGDPVPPPPEEPAGRVARYAWGLDYHAAVQERLRRFADALGREFGDVVCRPTVDVEPLLERAFARRSGLGFVGKNTNLIRPGGGSYLFLADLLVSLELPPDPPVPQGCGACRLCADDCPTGALDVPFELDARRCVAYHTIENRGSIPSKLRAGIGAWVFGCDLCQDACPFNARPAAADWPEFRPASGPGAWLPLREILRLRTSAAFNARFAGTSILRAKRAGLVRNACVAAANGGWARELSAELSDALLRDESAVVRGHAAWALGGAGARGRRALEDARRIEADPAARAEIDEALAA